jgi:3-oxoadipate enol-lactonase/4-carboxymuconolactone decarboxylase
MTVRLRWYEDGPPGAPPLVLLASVGASTRMWDPIAGALAEHHRVLRIDTRGHGDSPPAPAGGSPDIAELAADVLAVLDDRGLARVDLAGLSLGGMIGMWIAAHAPQRLGRLALLCTSAHLPPAQGWLDRAAAVRAGGMAAVVEPVTARWLTPALAERDPALLQRLRQVFTAVDAESYAQCCAAIAVLDLRPDLARIAAPTLVIAGADDPATPPEHARVIAAGIAGARVEVVSPAAHLAVVEQPGRIAALLLDHFRAAGNPAAGMTVRRAVLGDAHVDRAIAATTPFSDPFQQFITRYAWGEIWTRPGLTRRDRSIATIAALVAMGAERELALHLRAGLRNGLTRAELAEVLLHTAVYAGVPRANRAFAVAEQILAEDEPDS